MSTLDVPERQCLVGFFNDPNGFLWHHRLLLQPTPTPGVWIGATPDFAVELITLTQHRVVALTRASPFPQQYVAQVYAFDEDIDAAQLRDLREQGRALLDILGITAAGAAVAPAGVWRIADPAHKGFGEELPDTIRQAPDDEFVQRETCGMCRIDEEWVFCQMVLPDDYETWLESKRAGPGRDPRLIPHHGGKEGRSISFREAVTCYKPIEKQTGWPFKGKKVVGAFLAALVSAGLEFLSHHLEWAAKSGVNRSGNLCRTHRYISDTLTQLQQYDQNDLTNSAAAEFLVRWLLLIEKAVERNPKVLDFTGLEGFLTASVSEGGALQVEAFDSFVSAEQQSRAQILKQGRLIREERAAESRRTGDAGGGGGGAGGGRGGDGRGRGRGRKAKGAQAGAEEET